MKIPFNKISARYLEEKSLVDHAIEKVLGSGQYIGGGYVAAFEREFSAYHGVDHTVGCANGTDALFIALRALGVGPGDEVITTAFSWISTAMAISQTGARPVFVDIQDNDYQINLSLAEKAVNARTKALIPVYLYGNTRRRADFVDFAQRNKLALVEDAAQVHGIPLPVDDDAEKHVVCFSFYPTKQLGALGDAGAVICNYSPLHSRLRRIANLGTIPPYNDFEIVGINSRLDPIQAAVLSIRLKKINDEFALRQERATAYDRNLHDHFAKTSVHDKHSFYQYVIRSRDRKSVIKLLQKHQIGYGIHYDFTLPGTMAYGKQSGFPVAESAAREVISLPIDPLLTEDQIDYVCQVLNRINN